MNRKDDQGWRIASAAHIRSHLNFLHNAASEKRRKTREAERRRLYVWERGSCVYVYGVESRVRSSWSTDPCVARKERDDRLTLITFPYHYGCAHKLPVAGPLEGARPLGRVHASAASPLERWWKLNYARTARPCVSIKNGQNFTRL